MSEGVGKTPQGENSGAIYRGGVSNLEIIF